MTTTFYDVTLQNENLIYRIEMITETTKILNWKNVMILSAVSYVMYMLMWMFLDTNTFSQICSMMASDFLFDILLCFAFTYTSLGFCHLLFRYSPFKVSYHWMIILAGCILLFNNLVAFGMMKLFDCIWGGSGNTLTDELMNMKGCYTFAMISTFISSVYANAFYMRTIIEARNEKQALELALMKEKEIALQSQLNSLKMQINPHFLFNNFSTLYELIESKADNACDFLSHLSKVYRHIVRNLSVNLIDVRDELKFLDSYIYLMKLRHGDGIAISIDPNLRKSNGKIPPASLQLLVENAIKHNAISPQKPLMISIVLDNDRMEIRNIKHPLVSSPVESTGIGHTNIINRYALLSDNEIQIEDTGHYYSVSLPLL